MVENWIGISYSISGQIQRAFLKLSEKEDIPMEEECLNKQQTEYDGFRTIAKRLQYQPVELFAREGAKLLLRIAMEEDVAEFPGRLP